MTARLRFWNCHRKQIIENSKLNEKNSSLIKAIDFCENSKILKYLLDNKLIEKDFFDYIFPSKYSDLYITDIPEIKSMLLGKIDNDIQIYDPKKAVDYLEYMDADFRLIYSSDILEELLRRAVTEHHEDEKTFNKEKYQAHIILETVVNKSDYDFMGNIMQKLIEDRNKEGRDMFWNLAIEKVWEGTFFSSLFHKNNHLRDKKIAIKFLMNYWNDHEEWRKNKFLTSMFKF